MSATFRQLGLIAYKSSTKLRHISVQQWNCVWPASKNSLQHRSKATLAHDWRCYENSSLAALASKSYFNTPALLQTTRLLVASKYFERSCSFSTGNVKHANKSETKSSAAVTEADIFGEASNLGLFAKFKLMYKKYWYVLIPVHVVTSIGWLGGFYYLSTSGVDIPALLQYINFSDSIIEKVQGSQMGHIAIAYLCYKVATPLRYALTLGGTTVSIKYLVQSGYIKPMPSKKEFIKMYEQQKANRVAAKVEREEHETLQRRRQQRK